MLDAIEVALELQKGTLRDEREILQLAVARLDAFEANAKIRIAEVLVSMERFADAVPLLRRAQEIRPREDIARYLEQVERIAKARR